MTQLNNKAGFSAFTNKTFRILVGGRFLFIMSVRMLGTLLGWWIYKLTKDPYAIGMIGLSEVIPAVSLALYAGYVIDISEKKKLMLWSIGLYVLAFIILGILSYFSEHDKVAKHLTVYGIYGIIFMTGISRSFASPVFNTLLSGSVPKEMLQNATSWNQGAWLTASVMGHAGMGFMIAFFDITPSLWIAGSICLLGLIILSNISKQPSTAGKHHRDNPIESMKEGLRYVFHTKELLSAMSLDLFGFLFGGAVTMVPVFAKDILHVGPEGFGWLNAAADIGSMSMILWLTFHPFQKEQGKKLMMAIGGFGVCIIIFGSSNLYLISFGALLLSGALDGISVVVRGAILQLKTPNEMKGRVMSVNSMFINCSNELGQFESGLAARLLGNVPSVIFGGCMTLMVVLITWWKSPALKEMEY